jgi:hypothetical protein
MRPVKTGSTKDTTHTTPFARTAKPVKGNRPRKGTFVGPDDVVRGDGKSMTGSANEVIKTKLAFTVAKPKVGTSRTVFFKQHGPEAPSQNAVASTRLARFLGMPGIIAHNAFARIRGVEGVVSGKVVGNPMMGGEFLREMPVPAEYADDPALTATWAEALRLVQRDGKYYARSAHVFQPVDFRDPGVQKGMSDLQLFDALTGQTDRHGGNIYIDPVTGAVTGIDDDWSFGVGQPATDVHGNKRRDKYHGLPELVAEPTAEMILSLDPDDLPDELTPRKNDTEKLSTKDIKDAQLRLVTVQAYLQELKDAGKLRRVWNEETYRQALANPQGSYLGEQAGLLEQALARHVDAEGTDKAVSYKVADGPVIPAKPMRVNRPERDTPPRPPARPRARPAVRPDPLVLTRSGTPINLPPLPPDPGAPTRRGGVQPTTDVPRIVRIGATPRNAATARRGADLLPSIGDTIRPPETAETIVLSGSDDEIDPRVLTQINRMQDEELGSDESDREGYERLEVSGNDFVDSE